VANSLATQIAGEAARCGWLADGPSIRDFFLDDQEFLWSVLFYASHSDHETGRSVADIKENPDLSRYLADWGRPGDLGLIAEFDGIPVGAAWLRLFEGSKPGEYGFVDIFTPELAIAVLPEFRDRGVGSSLLADIVARSVGTYPRIVLTARRGNPAVRLYERFGWRAVDTVTNRVGTQSVRMVLDLTV
jgi:ribosomal protein S18 acetylase RimI-like enzyme